MAVPKHRKIRTGKPMANRGNLMSSHELSLLESVYSGVPAGGRLSYSGSFMASPYVGEISL